MLLGNDLLKYDYLTNRLRYISELGSSNSQENIENNFFKCVSLHKCFLHKNFCFVTKIEPYVLNTLVELAYPTF